MKYRSVHKLIWILLIGISLLTLWILCFNPIHRAVLSGNTRQVTILTTCLPFLVHERDYNLRTPLHLAASIGRYEIAKFLLQKRAKVNAKDENGMTPLHEAVRGNHQDLVELLIDNGADLNTRDSQGERTPLFFAISFGDTEVARLLLTRGADVNATNVSGVTPLCEAIGRTNLALADLLIRSKADVNLGNKQGVAPLHLACLRNRGQFVGLLLSNRANPNVINDLGESPLHIAALEGDDADSVQRLILAGARIDTRTPNGRTPLDCALQSNHTNIAQVLKDYSSIKASRSM